MSEITAAEKIEKACEEAHEKFSKLGTEEFADILSKLEFVLVSYRADGNPVGLYEIGALALEQLNAYKKQKPRMVSKKLIETMEKALEAKEV